MPESDDIGISEFYVVADHYAIGVAFELFLSFFNSTYLRSGGGEDSQEPRQFPRSGDIHSGILRNVYFQSLGHHLLQSKSIARLAAEWIISFFKIFSEIREWMEIQGQFYLMFQNVIKSIDWEIDVICHFKKFPER